MSITGQCLCGAVSLSLDAVNPDISVCHCSMCRTWGGGPFFAVSSPGEVRIQGKDAITDYPSSEWANRGFCQCCGTHLYYFYKNGNAYYLPAGLFTDIAGISITSQIFVDEKPVYYELANECQMLSGEQFMAMMSEQEDS